MADPFVGEIRIFAGNFAPRGWATCDGQLLPLSQNTALFSLLGTMYGGNGKSNFALPDLQRRAPMHAGQGRGLSSRFEGDSGGSETVTLTKDHLPPHGHALQASTGTASSNDPAGQLLGVPFSGDNLYAPSSSSQVALSNEALGPTGGSQPHNNMQPYLVLNFIIALQGVYPPRS